MTPDADGLVTLPDVAKAAGIDQQLIRKVVRDGFIGPAPIRKRHNTQTFTLPDALFIVAVAALAVAAGMAFYAMFRAITANGGEFDPSTGKVTLSMPNLKT